MTEPTNDNIQRAMQTEIERLEDRLEVAEIELAACKETMIEQSAEAYRLLKGLIDKWREEAMSISPFKLDVFQHCIDGLQAILEGKK